MGGVFVMGGTVIVEFWLRVDSAPYNRILELGRTDILHIIDQHLARPFKNNGAGLLSPPPFLSMVK